MKREINKLVKVIFEDIEEILNNNNVNKDILKQIKEKVETNKEMILNELLETKNMNTKNTFLLSDRKYKDNQKEQVEKIVEVIKEECSYFETFFDVFGGTGIISNAFNNLNKTIIINDILDANKCIYEAWFGSEEISLEKIKKHIDDLNKINIASDTKENYFSINYGDTFFKNKEAKKIWLIRKKIDELYNEKEIKEREKNILITSLIFAADKISNTCGNYESYSKSFKGIKNLYLECPDVKEKNDEDNQIHKKNANELVEKIEANIVYLDPPYTSRQYSEMYHLLDVIALGEELEVEGKAKKYKDRKVKRSQYCLKDAEKEFKDLIDKIKAEYIVVSYPKVLPELNKRSQPIIPLEKIEEILDMKGKMKKIVLEKNLILIVKVADYEFDKEVIYNLELKKKLKWKKERKIQQLKSIIFLMIYCSLKLDSKKDFKILIDKDSDIKDLIESIFSKEHKVRSANLEKYKFYDELLELQEKIESKETKEKYNKITMEMIIDRIKITKNIEDEIKEDEINVIFLNSEDKLENINNLLEKLINNKNNILFFKRNYDPVKNGAIGKTLMAKDIDPIPLMFFEEYLMNVITNLEIQIKQLNKIISFQNKAIFLHTKIKE